MAFISKSTNKCDHKIKIYLPCYPSPPKINPKKNNQHCDNLTLHAVVVDH